MSPASQSTEEEKDEGSQFSEGQLVSTSCQSDDSEISEETLEGKYGRSASKLEFSSLAKEMRVFSDVHCSFRIPSSHSELFFSL